MEGNRKMNCLAPSILAADFANLGEEIKIVDQAGAQYIHIDVMDGNFVPSISMGMPVIAGIRQVTDKILDVHLMVTQPERYIDDFVNAGADLITVHVEACIHLDRTIQKIKEKNVLAGVALNPTTPISLIEHILPELDMVLIMLVNPGFGGQKMIPYTVEKISELKQLIQKKGLKLDIQVDGGVTLHNVEILLNAGANIIVAGTSIFKGDASENVKGFLELMKE